MLFTPLALESLDLKRTSTEIEGGSALGRIQLQQAALRGALSQEKTLPMTQEEMLQQKAEIDPALASLSPKQEMGLADLTRFVIERCK